MHRSFALADILQNSSRNAQRQDLRISVLVRDISRESTHGGGSAVGGVGPARSSPVWSGAVQRGPVRSVGRPARRTVTGRL